MLARSCLHVTLLTIIQSKTFRRRAIINNFGNRARARPHTHRAAGSPPPPPPPPHVCVSVDTIVVSNNRWRRRFAHGFFQGARECRTGGNRVFVSSRRGPSGELTRSSSNKKNIIIDKQKE